MTQASDGPGEARERARAVKEKLAPELLADPNVSGVGVGLRRVGGRSTDEICVRVYVRKKLPPEEVPEGRLLPREVDGVRVDVIEARFELHQTDPSQHRLRRDPLVGGISVGNLILGGSGTLGASVFDGRSREDVILSNFHVLCGRSDCARGEPVIQPGQGGGDTGDGGDVVARLERTAVTDRVDAAIARLTGDRFLLRQALGVGPINGTASASLGMRVRKSGRTTGVTVGRIEDVDATVEISDFPGGSREFREQLVIENDGATVSDRGDSGSVWIDDGNRIVGLNFAGSGTDRALANPIQAVLADLDISLVEGVTQQEFLASGILLFA